MGIRNEIKEEIATVRIHDYMVSVTYWAGLISFEITGVNGNTVFTADEFFHQTGNAMAAGLRKVKLIIGDPMSQLSKIQCAHYQRSRVPITEELTEDPMMDNH